MKSLHKYMKQIILIYEAIENPILQKFIKIDVNFDPNYEYAPIPHDKPNSNIALIKEGDQFDIEGYQMFKDLPTEQLTEFPENPRIEIQEEEREIFA